MIWAVIDYTTLHIYNKSPSSNHTHAIGCIFIKCSIRIQGYELRAQTRQDFGSLVADDGSPNRFILLQHRGGRRAVSLSESIHQIEHSHTAEISVQSSTLDAGLGAIEENNLTALALDGFNNIIERTFADIIIFSPSSQCTLAQSST